MTECPHCKKDLGDLEPIMNELAKNKTDGEYFFQSECCDEKMKGFSENWIYYVEAVGILSDKVMIGAA